MASPEVNGVGKGDNVQYTPVKVYDKDSKKTFTVKMINTDIQGNEATWKIRDGKVYDKNGKSLEDLRIEVTRYQAALIKAAASVDGDGSTLDFNDLNGLGFAQNAKEALAQADSEYKLLREGFDYKREQDPEGYPTADAAESGIIDVQLIKRNEQDVDNPDNVKNFIIDMYHPNK